jgi:LysR family transcriptional activator of nhaA
MGVFTDLLGIVALIRGLLRLLEGVFPAADWVHDDLLTHYAVQRLGPCEGVTEHFFAVGTEKKVQHPLVQSLLQPAL